MKYLYIGLALLVLVGAFCAVNGKVLDSRLAEIETLIDGAVSNLESGDEQSSVEYMRAASELWNKHANYFTSVLLHSRVDDAQQQIRAALALLERGEGNQEALPLALEKIKSLRESERLLIGNIL